jgi:hypothetical protein
MNTEQYPYPDNCSMSEISKNDHEMSGDETSKISSCAIHPAVVEECSFNPEFANFSCSTKDTLITILQNKKVIANNKAICSGSPFFVKLCFRLANSPFDTRIPEDLSYCSLWLAIYNRAMHSYMQKESRIYRISTDSLIIRDIIPFNKIKSGHYQLHCRINIPFQSRMVKASRQLILQ